MKAFLMYTFLAFFLSGCLNQPRSPEAVIVEAPISQPSNIDSKDSSVLHIVINKNDYDVFYLNDTSLNIGSERLDLFVGKITTSITSMDKIIINSNNQSEEGWKKLKEILKKRSIMKFRLVTTNQ